MNGRLPVLLRWPKEAQPDIVCLQGLKAPEETFPEHDLCQAGYGAVWHGQKSRNGVAILARGPSPVETRRSLLGDPEDPHSRYIEATVRAITIGCLHLPNGNPAPDPKRARRSTSSSSRVGSMRCASSIPTSLDGAEACDEAAEGYRVAPGHSALPLQARLELQQPKQVSQNPRTKAMRSFMKRAADERWAVQRPVLPVKPSVAA